MSEQGSDTMSEQYDVIIIGTGAGGGTMARALAVTGKKILLLERGGWLPREKENLSSKAVFLEARYKAKEVWLDKRGHEIHPGIHYYVGGNTKVYGAALFRFRKQDFGELKHHGGVSPAWPIAYDDLEPYYAEAERLYQVHGQRGADPTEPPASGPYPHPPVSHEGPVAELAYALRGLGHKPFPLPLGIQLDEARPESSRCMRCQTCDGFPCIVDGKSDASVCGVRPALEHSNVTLLTHALVTRLETDPSGRTVTRVHVRREGKVEEYSAHIVIVACGAVNSAALLLRSRSDSHPEGLANASGVVGRHYMAHNNTAFVCVTTRKNPTVFEKTLALNDYYFAAPDSELPLGHIQMLGKSDGTMLKGDAPPLTPLFALDIMAEHAFDFWLTSEDLPHPDNRVTVDGESRIHLAHTPNNLEAHARLVRKLKELCGKLLPWGLKLAKRIPIEGTAHQCGTVRFGHDAKTSALDVTCKAHDVDNLYVVDGSFFVSSTAVNPALTIIANALRVADHVRARLV
jgi:choline dehydrogenase-like flavoprotein